MSITGPVHPGAEALWSKSFTAVEAVQAVYGHGFADYVGDLTVDWVGYTHAEVSAEILRMYGEDELAAEMPEGTYWVIIRTLDSGQRDVMFIDTDEQAAERTWRRTVQSFEALA